MQFCFYPRHEYACPNVGHCPHLGGAALATLVHAARDWQKVVPAESTAFAFFEAVKTWVTRGCRLHRNRQQLSADESAQEKAWIRAELERLVTCPLDHDKGLTLQQRMVKHHDEWLVFLDNPTSAAR